MGRYGYLWHTISKRRIVEPPYWRLNHIDRKKMREIYYGTVDPVRRSLWRMLMKAYYHKVSEKEIMDYLIYYRGYSKDDAHNLMMEIKGEWLLFELIKVKEK